MYFFRFSEAKFAVFTALFVLAVFLPVFAFGGTQTIYVDDDATGTEDGTKSHPYKKITAALKVADDGDEVRVLNGTYRENITVPSEVRLVGDDGDRTKVVIDGDDDKPTVRMRHDSELSNVTVKHGRHGVEVAENAKAHLYNVLIRNAERDGIHADRAPRDKKHRLFLDKVEIEKSGKAGVYSEKRFVVIVNSYIQDNLGDGIDFRSGVNAWMEDTRVYENRGSGWKVVMDGGEIWSKDNQFRRNGREGIQVESYEGTGKFGVKKSKIVDNGRFGIAILARGSKATDMSKHIFLDNNDSWGNVFGSLSSVIRMF